MASAVGQLWRAVAPDAIDTSLPDLWMEAARETPVSRALMSNLVVISHGARGQEHPASEDPVDLPADSDIIRIAERHPARIILLNYVPTTGQPCGPSRATIGVLTFGAGAMRYGVEAITIDAKCAEASLPSIVRRLTRGDVPTTLWWTPDLSRVHPPKPLVETGRQFLYDSAAWDDVGEGARTAARILGMPHSPDLADLNWFRLNALRWAVVHALGHEPRRSAALPTSVRIHHHPAERTAATLLGAWLRRALPANAAAEIDQSVGEGDLLTIEFKATDWMLTAAMNRERVLVDCGGARPPFTMPVPRETVADLVLAELRNLGRDVYLRETMIALAQVTGAK